MTVEHPIVFEDCHSVAHVGLQFRAELNPVASVLGNLWFKREEQWTTTMFVWPNCNQANPPSLLSGADEG